MEQVIEDIVDQNFDLYKRITDDAEFGEVVKNHLFEEYLRKNRPGQGDVDSPIRRAGRPLERNLDGGGIHSHKVRGRISVDMLRDSR